MTVSPSSMSRLLLQGRQKRYALDLRITAQLPAQVYVLVTDTAGAFESTIPLQCSTAAVAIDCKAVVTVRSALPSGTTAGALELNICADAACNSRLANASLAYSFNVVGSGTLSSLIRLPAAEDWGTMQGNAAHSGFMPATLDPSRFSLRWIWEAPNTSSNPMVSVFTTTPVSSARHQMLFVAANRSDGSASRLFGIRELDGATAWTINFPAFQYPGPAAVSGDQVYAAVFNGDGGTELFFRAYDAATGNVRFSTTYVPNACQQGCAPGHPVVANGVAYVNGGSPSLVGGPRPPVMAFNAVSGNLLWTGATGGTAGQSVAVDANGIYTYTPNSNTQSGPGFAALNVGTGAITWGVGRPTTAPPSSGQVYYQGSTPVLDGSGGALVRLNTIGFDGPLIRIDLATRAQVWESTTTFFTNPAVTDGTIFAAADKLYALASSSGAVLWSAPLPPLLDGVTAVDSVIATSNIIFVATAEDVFAIDRQTRALVWAFPVGGRIALSANGILYVSTPTQVYAVNLQ